MYYQFWGVHPFFLQQGTPLTWQPPYFNVRKVFSGLGASLLFFNATMVIMVPKTSILFSSDQKTCLQRLISLSLGTSGNSFGFFYVGFWVPFQLMSEQELFHFLTSFRWHLCEVFCFLLHYLNQNLWTFGTSLFSEGHDFCDIYIVYICLFEESNKTLSKIIIAHYSSIWQMEVILLTLSDQT